MRIGISGTYSSGKTFTAMALSHYTGIPRTRAKTMREILPDAAPGKTLEECTAAELIQMIVVRHTERVLHEYQLRDGFISDGSSLQEWIYGTVRVTVGINPNASIGLLESVTRTPEIQVFESVMTQLGVAFKQHVRRSFDVFIHLPNELPLTTDGHRPVNEQFRSMSDDMLRNVVEELDIPYHVVGGDASTRLGAITELYGLPKVTTIERATELAVQEYAALDVRPEAERMGFK